MSNLNKRVKEHTVWLPSLSILHISEKILNSLTLNYFPVLQSSWPLQIPLDPFSTVLWAENNTEISDDLVFKHVTGNWLIHACNFLKAIFKLLVTQSCLTLCDPMDCGPPGSSVHGILQARILEWVAIPFFRGTSRPRDRTLVSCIAGRFFIVWATWEALYELKTV